MSVAQFFGRANIKGSDGVSLRVGVGDCVCANLFPYTKDRRETASIIFLVSLEKCEFVFRSGFVNANIVFLVCLMFIFERPIQIKLFQ